MPALTKIDSNVVGLRYAEETSLKVLPGTPTWYPFEPNSFADFGGQITTVPREPINDSRQRKKGVVTDKDASGGFNTDLTQSNLQDIMQGFFFADLREKNQTASSGTGGTSAPSNYGDFTAIETGFAVGDLMFVTGFDNPENNGLKTIASVSASTIDVVETDIVTEVVPSLDVTYTKVGVETAVGDIDVDASGSLPKLTSTVLDFTTLDLVPGEWVFIGGDAALNQFSTAANNGFVRVNNIAANELTIDKSYTTMVTEANTTQEVHIYLGRVLKNETGTLIKRRTYNLERTLGVPNTDNPNDTQSEYLVGSVANEAVFNLATADKETVDLSFVALDSETRDASTGPKSGNRPAIVEADAFNTSSDVRRQKLTVIDPATSNPTSLFAYVTDVTINLNNNATPNKAIGVLGGFEVTVGNFEVSTSMEAYFADVAAIDAVNNNESVTYDLHKVKSNAGISIDLPLLTLGDGRPNVTKDEPIKLPLSGDAATGAGVDANLNHTMLMVYWDYLPDLAEG